MDSNTDEVQDDAIIGLVFRWSVVAMLVIAATVAAGLTMRRMWRPPTEAPKAKDTEQIHSLPQANQPLPSIPFLDVTRQAGIDFVHANGATGEKLLPETMGGGVAFLDYDNDGDQDLFFVNSRSWDENATGAQETQRLFANDGAGGYTDVTEAARLSVSLYGMGWRSATTTMTATWTCFCRPSARTNCTGTTMASLWTSPVRPASRAMTPGAHPAGFSTMTATATSICLSVTTCNGHAKSTSNSTSRSMAPTAPTGRRRIIKGGSRTSTKTKVTGRFEK